MYHIINHGLIVLCPQLGLDNKDIGEADVAVLYGEIAAEVKHSVIRGVNPSVAIFQQTHGSNELTEYLLLHGRGIRPAMHLGLLLHIEGDVACQGPHDL